MRKKRLTTLILIILLATGKDVFAEVGVGGTRSVFTLGAGSRAISLGGAFSAIGDDPSVIYYNPAGLKLNKYTGIMVNHIQLFSDFSGANYDFVGAVYPTLLSGAFGIGIMTTGTGGIRAFDEFSNELGEISYRESQGLLAYAFDIPFELLGKFTLGTSIKVLNQSIGDYSDTGTGMDVGVLYRLSYLKGFVLGCNIQDIVGAETKLVSISERVDRTMMFGVGYSYEFQNGSALIASAQVDMPERADNDLRFGIEYDLKNIISFRVGFDSEQITAGIGFSWQEYTADYGYFSRDEAGSSHPFSISVNLGESIERKREALAARRREEEEGYLKQVLSDRLKSHLQKAKSLRKNGELEKAYDEFKIALEYDPSDVEASRLISVLEDEIIKKQQQEIKSVEKQVLIKRHFKLGLKYYGNNEYLLSRGEWNSLLEIDPDNENAKGYIKKIEEKLSKQIDRHRKKAIDFEEAGKLAAALDEWNMIKALNPKHKEAEEGAQRLKDRLRAMSVKFDSARIKLTTIDLFEKALNNFSTGDYSKAEEQLGRVLKIQPDHKEALKLLDRARRRITPLKNEEKEQIRKLYIDGMKHFTQRKYKSAIEVWNKILKIDPDNESIKKNIEEAGKRLEIINSGEKD
ncbi:PorV/PorQ family protein [bacterium]|nr:PorV/PorQ family protein [bacterium]